MDCDFPERLLYDVENNVWMELEGGTARVGVNAMDQRHIELHHLGLELCKGRQPRVAGSEHSGEP